MSNTLAEKVQDKIRFSNMTVSYALERRSMSGEKKSLFFSTTINGQDDGFTKEEADMAKIMALRYVSQSVLVEANRQGIMSIEEAASEKKRLDEAYETVIASLEKRHKKNEP